jgi:hypothetical protein
MMRWVAIKRKSLVRVISQVTLKSSLGALWTIAELKRLGKPPHHYDQHAAIRGIGQTPGPRAHGWAILYRFLPHAQTIAITGRSYRLKSHTAIAGKEDKTRKT